MYIHTEQLVKIKSNQWRSEGAQAVDRPGRQSEEAAKRAAKFRVLAHLSKSNSRTFQGPHEG